MKTAVLSIHDVMPETMERVAEIIELVPSAHRNKILLLVVPGLAWQPEQLMQLRQWTTHGLQLAGHGWHHKTEKIETLWHKLHATFVSRDVAEHLSITAEEELTLMQANRDWFEQNGLPISDWYVPPAWAFGQLPINQRSDSGYRLFESTFFVYDSRAQRHHFLPMVGYEADTLLRKWSVRAWNAINRVLGRWRPVRIGIHPQDLSLLLADDLRRDLTRIASEQVELTHPDYLFVR
ncbi:polysaccharide deacetylase family protein [Salinibius halmophilus]|uniref:polysaccharide deacetylase family protein n=1 Tax=Salinibius halmophilus TaxID=1853216 RepID=UPI000E67356B|nr:polysaccharide deacetylase family protein [Salinibius halmophilus]